MKRLVPALGALFLCAAPSTPAFARAGKVPNYIFHGNTGATQLKDLPPGTFEPGGLQISFLNRFRVQTRPQALKSFAKSRFGRERWTDMGLSCWGHTTYQAINGAMTARGEDLSYLQQAIVFSADMKSAKVPIYDNFDRTKPFVLEWIQVPTGVYVDGYSKNIHYKGENDYMSLVRQAHAIMKIRRDPTLAPQGILADHSGNTVDGIEWATGLPGKVYANGSVTLWQGTPLAYAADKTTWQKVQKDIWEAHMAKNPMGADTLADTKTGSLASPGALDRIEQAVTNGIISPIALTAIKSIKTDLGLYPGHALILSDPGLHALTAEQEKFYAERGLLGIETAPGVYTGLDGFGINGQARKPRNDQGQLLVQGVIVTDPSLRGSIGNKRLDKHDPGYNLFKNEKGKSNGSSIVPNSAFFALFGFVHLGPMPDKLPQYAGPAF